MSKVSLWLFKRILRRALKRIQLPFYPISIHDYLGNTNLSLSLIKHDAMTIHGGLNIKVQMSVTWELDENFKPSRFSFRDVNPLRIFAWVTERKFQIKTKQIQNYKQNESMEPFRGCIIKLHNYYLHKYAELFVRQPSSRLTGHCCCETFVLKQHHNWRATV